MHALLRSVAVVAVTAATAGAAPKEQAPSVDQALGLKPIQKGIEYDRPTGADAKACTIKPQREGKGTSWVVRDGQGRMLRRFADTNADNVVDQWCYYQNGLEVYRDVDTNHDSRADQYRWFHTGGSRWGIDDNQDTKIDRWRRISPQELAEEAFAALRDKDAARFERLLISADELKRLGAGKELTDKFGKSRRNAARDFATLAKSQKLVGAKSRFVDFGAPRPGVVPAGLDGASEDVLVYENASALIDNDGAPEQLLLGSLVKVGDGWRLIEAPQAGSTNPELANVFSVPSLGGAAQQGAGAPSEATQKLLAELEKLDGQAAGATPAQQKRLTAQRVALLEQLAAGAKDRADARQWYTQLADLLSAAAQAEGYTPGIAKLAALEKAKAVRAIGPELIAEVRYRRIGAENAVAFQNPKTDYTKQQEKWIGELSKFVEDFPTNPNAAEAMLQLGSISGEFAGKIDVAERWYRRVASEFPSTPSGKKAAGALRRLGSIGKSIQLRGDTLSGGRIDLATSPYRGKHVLVHYWASWSGPEQDMIQIESLRTRYRGKLEVIGVNLDQSAADAKTLLAKQKTGWKHLHDAGGLEGDRAEQMGVMTLPLMLLIDDKGKVVNRDLHSSELVRELERVIR